MKSNEKFFVYDFFLSGTLLAKSVCMLLVSFFVVSLLFISNCTYNNYSTLLSCSSVPWPTVYRAVTATQGHYLKQILYTLLPKCVLFRTPLVGLQRPPDPQLYCTLPPAALVWDTGAPILREKSPPLKFCTRPPTLIIRHWSSGSVEANTRR